MRDFYSLFTSLFYVIASVVALGWGIRIVGGDPLQLLVALPSGLHPCAALGETVDMLFVLLLMIAGCSVAGLAGVSNIAADAQMSLGFVLAAFVLAPAASGLVAISAACLPAVLVGAMCSLIILPLGRRLGDKAEIALGLVVNTLVVSLIRAASFPPSALSRSLLFPLFVGRDSPRAGVFLALSLLLALSYLKKYTNLGFRVSQDVKPHYFAYVLAGGFCGVAGALALLNGMRWLQVTGLGYVAFSITAMQKGRLGVSTVIITLLVSAILCGWPQAARSGLTPAAFGGCLLSAWCFLDTDEEQEERGAP